MSAIPTSWLAQLADGGRIVADMRGALVSTLVVLTKLTDGSARGRFTDTSGHFMWLRDERDHPLRDGESIAITLDRDNATRSITSFDPAGLGEVGLRLLVQLSLPDISSAWTAVRAGTRYTCLVLADGSWSEVNQQADAGGFAVTEGGPRRIWPRVEAVARQRNAWLGPTRSRFGLTARPDGSVALWLDRPENPITLP